LMQYITYAGTIPVVLYRRTTFSTQKSLITFPLCLLYACPILFRKHHLQQTNNMKLFRPLSHRQQDIAKPVQEDDASSVTSMHSTMTTLGQNKRQKSRHDSHERRRVHFNAALNVMHDSPYRDDENAVSSSPTWYTADEMQAYKDQSRWVAREIYRVESQDQQRLSYTKVMEQIYATCCQAPNEIQDDSSCLTPLQQKNLAKYVQGHAGRIGLDRLCIREIARSKRERRLAVVDVVLARQDEVAGGRTPQQQHQCDQALCWASQSVSRASRLFARELALAQWEDSIFF